jgi:hypothetical protein
MGIKKGKILILSIMKKSILGENPVKHSEWACQIQMDIPSNGHHFTGSPDRIFIYYLFG